MTFQAPPASVLAIFGISAGTPATLVDTGHIHRTWRMEGADAITVQRVNESVFRDAAALERNLARAEVILAAHDVPTIRWRRTADGSILHRDDGGALWRSYDWIPGTVSATVASLQDVEAIGRVFGRFAGALADVEPSSFTETIPSFHDFAARERAWRFAVLRDEVNRYSRSQPEVERAARLLDRLQGLPEFDSWTRQPRRIVHNDAKAANVVRAGERLTVIDLDTTMPGPLFADLGELVRTVCRTAPEDDDRVANALQTERVGLLLRGWLSGYGRPLHPIEADVAAIAGIVLTVENALRFLTDYLEGDVYFAVDRPEQNLARYRAQIGHAQVMLDGVDDLRRVAAHELERHR